jgi:hypothetical protein
VTATKGQIVDIDVPGLFLYAIITDRYKGAQANEFLTAPNANGQIAAAYVAAEELIPTTVWEEAFMSDFRGWPGSVNVDRQRLIFCDFKQLPGAILESAINEFEDFEVGGDAAAAIFEISPQRERVLHVGGGADQFILTDNTIYYVPISADNPLAPGRMEFRALGTGGASALRPMNSTLGPIFVSADNLRVMGIRQTGQQAQPYRLEILSRYHAALLNAPVDIAISHGQAIDADETLFIVNGDGSMAVGRINAGSDFIGFVPWTTLGAYIGVASLRDEVYLATCRDLPDDKCVNAIEKLDYAMRLDCTICTTAIHGGAALTSWRGATMSRIVDGLYKGECTIGANGIVSGLAGQSPTKFGFNFTPTFEPFVGNFDRGQSESQRMRRRRISRGALTVRDAGPIKVNNTDLSGYRIGDDNNAPPIPRDSTFTFRVMGRKHDPGFTVTQPEPYGFQIIEVGMEVTI